MIFSYRTKTQLYTKVLAKTFIACSLLGLLICSACGNIDDQTEEWITPQIEQIISVEQNDNSMQTDFDNNNVSLIPESDEPEVSPITDSKEPDNDEQSSSINLIMVGDVLLHTPLEECYRQPDGTYDYSGMFSFTRDKISSADIALVNQEVIIGGEDLGVSGYPCFNAPYSVGDELVNTGFDVICHGTNHAMDKGKKGIVNCLDFWQQNYPSTTVLGIYDSAQNRDNVFIYEQNGIRLAILNYTYGTNGIELPSDMPFAVNLLKENQVRADIQYAEENADFTIVCPHWGTEYRLTPDSMQEKWTRIFMEEGVDLVIGTHPHVIEPVVELTDEATNHKMLVYYSLGNYINWTGSSGSGIANRMVGGMADVTISKDTNGNVFIEDYDVDALVTHLINETNGPTTYFLRDYSSELAASNAIRSQDSSFSYDYCINLCNEVWGEIWK